jgi:hypothetical protein
MNKGYEKMLPLLVEAMSESGGRASSNSTSSITFLGPVRPIREDDFTIQIQNERIGGMENIEILHEEVFEALEFDMLHQPNSPYEAKTTEEVVKALIKVVPHIDKKIVTEVAVEFLDHYKAGRI